MPGAFDPYHEWLGIPPEEQPPNHYRLLGIPLFEPDPQVIRHAVEEGDSYQVVVTRFSLCLGW